MYIEDKLGFERATEFVKVRLKKNITNSDPIIRPKGSTAKLTSGNDVYYKAAHVLHTIRYLVGKDILWSTLKEFLYMPKELSNNQTSTLEFISLLNENSNMDLHWVFNQFMYKESIPTLYIKEKTRKTKRFVDLWWKEEGFKMPIEVSYGAIEGIRTKSLDLGNAPTRIVVPDSLGLEIDPKGWVLFKLENIDN